jgi:outer membrane immunogenic protein
MKYPVLIAAALVTTAAPAYAQDLSGFRIEGRAAWEQSGAKATIANPDFDEDDDESGPEFFTSTDDDSAIAYGVELGYDLQIGSGLVIGAYAGAELSDTRVCNQLIEDDLGCSDLKRTFTVGGRVGVPVGRSSLVYAKGGYSSGRFDVAYDPDITDNDDDEPGDTYAFSKSRGGFHVGAGVEVGLSQGLYGKLEYVYTDYGKGSYLLDDGSEGAQPSLKVGSDRHQVGVGIGLRF